MREIHENRARLRRTSNGGREPLQEIRSADLSPVRLPNSADQLLTRSHLISADPVFPLTTKLRSCEAIDGDLSAMLRAGRMMMVMMARIKNPAVVRGTGMSAVTRRQRMGGSQDVTEATILASKTIAEMRLWL